MLRCWVCFGIQAGPHTQTGLTRCEPAYICFRGAARRRWGPRSGEEFSHPYKDLGTEFSGVWFDADLHSYPDCRATPRSGNLYNASPERPKAQNQSVRSYPTGLIVLRIVATHGRRRDARRTLNPNLTSPIRPAVARFSSGKSLSGKGERAPKQRKSAVVPTKSILTAANVPIIGGHHVLALQSSPEGWQAPPLLERCREHAGRPGTRGAAARSVSGRDQRHAGVGVAAVDRGARGRRLKTADAVAVSGRPLRRGGAGGRLSRPRQAVAVAVRRPRQWGGCWLALML